MNDTTANIDGNNMDAIADGLIMGQAPAEEVEAEAESLDAQEEQGTDEATADDAETVDEDEAEEAEAEDAEEYDDDDDAEEADEEPEKLYTVKVKGEEKQVTLDELRRGYSGQQYIQQQMEEVANAKKEAEGIYHQLQSEAQQIAALRQRLETGGIPAQPTPPDMSMLDSDPIGYMQAKAQYDQDLASWQGQMQELEAVNQRQQAMQQQAMQHHLAQEAQRLQEAIPEFGDETKGPELRKAVAEAGTAYGYSPEELSQVVDSRAVRVLHDAMKYREMVAARGEVEKKVEKARPVVKPGVKKSATTGKAKQRKMAQSRMKKSGSVDDVANFLLS